jgi:nucleoside-diphosphate-sugar epimerase
MRGTGLELMRALVTGANGFTGSHLARLLAARGHDVLALVRESADLTPLHGLPVETRFADLAADRPLDEAVQGADVVFHIAAAYRAENIPRRVFWDVNVHATRRLLDAAKRSGIQRFVHCSTVGVQGHIESPPATEEAPFRPGDHYQESKRDAEVMALEFFEREGLPGTVVRPTGIYGPGDTRFLKLFRMIHSGRFRMIGSGDVLYHLTYVEDLVEGILLAAEKDAALNEVFTLGGNEYVTLNEFVAKIAATVETPLRRGKIPVWPVWLAGAACEAFCRPFGISPPIYRRRVDFFTKSRAFDISKAKTRLGYEPTVSLDDGLRRTARWYRAQGLLA